MAYISKINGDKIKLPDSLSINGMSFDGTNSITCCTGCSTGGNVAAKQVTLNGWTNENYSFIYVTFANDNTASNPTLTITSDGTAYGPYQIRHKLNEAIPSDYIKASCTYCFVKLSNYMVLVNPQVVSSDSSGSDVVTDPVFIGEINSLEEDSNQEFSFFISISSDISSLSDFPKFAIIASLETDLDTDLDLGGITLGSLTIEAEDDTYEMPIRNLIWTDDTTNAEYSAGTLELSQDETLLITYDGHGGCRITRLDFNPSYDNLSASKNGTSVSLVSTGEKYVWNNKAPVSKKVTLGPITSLPAAYWVNGIDSSWTVAEAIASVPSACTSEWTIGCYNVGREFATAYTTAFNGPYTPYDTSVFSSAPGAIIITGSISGSTNLDLLLTKAEEPVTANITTASPPPPDPRDPDPAPSPT